MLTGLFMTFGYAVRVHVFLMLAYWLVLTYIKAGSRWMAMATVASLHVYDVHQMLSLSSVQSLQLAGCLLMVSPRVCVLRLRVPRSSSCLSGERSVETLKLWPSKFELCVSGGRASMCEYGKDCASALRGSCARMLFFRFVPLLRPTCRRPLMIFSSSLLDTGPWCDRAGPRPARTTSS